MLNPFTDLTTGELRGELRGCREMLEALQPGDRKRAVVAKTISLLEQALEAKDRGPC